MNIPDPARVRAILRGKAEPDVGEVQEILWWALRLHADNKRLTRDTTLWQKAQESTLNKLGSIQQQIRQVTSELRVRTQGASEPHRFHDWRAHPEWDDRQKCAGCPAERLLQVAA